MDEFTAAPSSQTLRPISRHRRRHRRKLSSLTAFFLLAQRALTKDRNLAAMASLRAVQRAATLPPTVRTLPSGVPSALHINLRTRAPEDAHGHDHGHGASSSRVDAPRAFAQKNVMGLASKSYTTGVLSIFWGKLHITDYPSTHSYFFYCETQSHLLRPTLND